MEPKRRPRIFISYRQNDSSGYVNHLQETLANHFGEDQVFRDILTLPSGADFAEVIKNEVAACDVMLVVMAKSWLTTIKQKQAEAKEDYVRYEVAAALKARKTRTGLQIVPVMVQGADFPAKQDLPEDLQDLAKLHGRILSDRWWQQDVARLVKDLNKALGLTGQARTAVTDIGAQSKKRLGSNTETSILGGALAGLATGTVVGIAYTATENVPWWRFILVSVYGLVAGGLVSWSINLGVEKISRLMGHAAISKIVGALLGGVVSGLIAGLIGGFGFAWLSGNVVNPGWVVAAVATSSFFITAGILLPDLRQDWSERLIVLVLIASTTGVIAFVAAWLLFEKLRVLDSLVTRSPFSVGVIVLGLLCGAMAGAQVGLALFIYEFRSRHRVETNQ